MFDPDKWAEKTDEWLKAHNSQTDARDAALVVKRSLLDARTRALWNELRDTLKSMCDSYNKLNPGTLHFDVVPNTEFVVKKTRGAGAVIEGEYNASLHRIAIGSSASGAKWIYVGQTVNTGDGDVVLVGQEGGSRSIEEIADTTMKDLLYERN